MQKKNSLDSYRPWQELLKEYPHKMRFTWQYLQDYMRSPHLLMHIKQGDLVPRSRFHPNARIGCPLEYHKVIELSERRTGIQLSNESADAKKKECRKIDRQILKIVSDDPELENPFVEGEDIENPDCVPDTEPDKLKWKYLVIPESTKEVQNLIKKATLDNAIFLREDLLRLVPEQEFKSQRLGDDRVKMKQPLRRESPRLHRQKNNKIAALSKAKGLWEKEIYKRYKVREMAALILTDYENVLEKDDDGKLPEVSTVMGYIRPANPNKMKGRRSKTKK